MIENLLQDLVDALNRNTKAILENNGNQARSNDSDVSSTESVKESQPVAKKAKPVAKDSDDEVEEKSTPKKSTKKAVVEEKADDSITLEMVRTKSSQLLADGFDKEEVRNKIKEIGGGTLIDLDAEGLSELYAWLCEQHDSML